MSDKGREEGPGVEVPTKHPTARASHTLKQNMN